LFAHECIKNTITETPTTNL